MNTDRAIQLLGQGHAPRVVAAALGVTESAISQLLSSEATAKEVAEKRAEALSRYTEMDDKWNALENRLLDKLEKVVPLLMKPRDILHALDKVNGAKRRGSLTPQDTLPQDRVVSLDLPPAIQYNFITNINKQVVEVTEGNDIRHPLITIPTDKLEGLSNEKRARALTAGGQAESAENESADATALSSESPKDLASRL